MLFALLIASLTPDIVDAAAVLFHICNPYGLYSHTIPAVVIEAAIVGALAYLATGSRSTTLSFVLVVILHIGADYFTGRKLLMPGGEMVGLRGYDWPLRDFVVEVTLVIVGWWLLRRAGRTPSWTTSPWLLLIAIGVQAAFDMTVVGHGRPPRATACFPAPAR